MTLHNTGRVAVAAITVLALLLLGPWAYRYAHGLSLVVRGANVHGLIRVLAPLTVGDVNVSSCQKDAYATFGT